MTARMMRAGTYLRPNEIALQSRPIPEPGAGEVRVRVRACGVCGSDLHLLHLPTPMMESGRTMGHEIAGTIDALGAGVTALEVGQHVVVEPLHTCGVCSYCQAGRDSICPSMQLHGMSLDGGFADYVVVQARRLFPVPREMDFALAAFIEQTAVAVHGLRLGGFRAGGRVLVLGAGPIGLATVAVAKVWGAREVVLTARYAHQAELGRRLGASDILSGVDASPEALGSLCRERPAELVVETVGGTADTLTGAIAAVAPGGTVSVLGVFVQPVPVDPIALFYKEARLQWCNCYARVPGHTDFEESVRLVTRHGAQWSSVLTHAVPLDAIDRAFELAADKRSGVSKVSVVTEN